MDKVQKIVYINLEKRLDRKNQIESEFEKIYVKAERFNAIEHERGNLGCTLSHIECLKMGVNENLDHIMIAEDDLVFTMNREELDQIVNKIFELPQWDVVLLSSVINSSQFVSKGISKAIDVQTATLYLVNKHYIPVLIENFELSVQNLLNGGANHIYSLDVFWKQLQKKDNWFVLTPSVGYQKEDYSNIEKRMVDYKSFFNRPFTVLLMGGLGNQMFQIAFGLSLQYKQGAQFCLCNQMKNPHSTKKYWFMEKIPLLKNPPNTRLEEPDYASFICLDMPNISPWSIFEFVGYFQNEKYFKDFKKEIVEFLTPTVDELLTSKYDKLIQSSFIHVRRGDYMTNPVHRIDLTSYYKKCIQPDEHYYVFSDDLEWCKNNLQGNMTFVDEDEVNSLWLMSKCLKGGICANSSFSWWGSYLNTNPEKKVYFPSKWINRPWNVEIYPDYAIIVQV